MTLTTFQKYVQTALAAIYPKTEIDSFFFLMIADQLNLKRIDLVLNPNLEISKEQQVALEKITFRLKKEEPIQYILGKTAFFGLPFAVNEHTLIPRPETEELVAWILEVIKEKRLKNKEAPLSILDIGTGTGCIPISLAKNLEHVAISAMDISAPALQIAKQNADLNNVTINFLEQDILKMPALDQTFDIIISNPPYVRELEKTEMQANVLQNEPHLALFVSDDLPLLFYDKIASLAKKHLSKDGFLFFEINQYLGKETLALLANKGFTNMELKKDISNNDRMIKAQ